MAKPEWGMKRTCQSCGSRFYDLHHDPIHCPKCSAVYDPEAVLKTKRSSRTLIADKPAPKLVKDDADLDAVDGDIDVDLGEDALVKDDDEEEDLIEDTSELGDDDDMGAVIEKVDEE